MAIKRYSRKEPLVFLLVIVPYVLFINLLLFGICAYRDGGTIARSFGYSMVYFFIIYGFFGWVATIVKNRHPSPADLFLRIRILLPVFYVLNIFAIWGAFASYDLTGWLHCPTRPQMFWWTVLYACIMSTVITFINEGMANWDAWKASLAEGEKLQNAYQRSKLLGLKGQINPHFLFNCFNSLSGLIHEDQRAAERFLDEMIKVHRYLLRGDDEYLVPLRDELKFADAYLHLTRARFGPAIQVELNVPQAWHAWKLPPLSLQVILEHIIYTNTASKRTPLLIRIGMDEADGRLEITHNTLSKTMVRELNVDEGMDNLIRKFALLGAPEVVIRESDGFREISLPLFTPDLAIA